MFAFMFAFTAGVACGGRDNRSKPRPTASPPAPDDSAVSAQPPAAQAPSLAAEVPTDTFEPEPIRIAVADLPAPFATDSARKSPEVVDMPADARLRAPAGVRVQVFAEGLDMPRWLQLTPEGHVLVTETDENRITRLVDADGDGVAERREVFATADNGLNIPFGMAFAADSFYVGNTNAVLRFPYSPGQGALEGEGSAIAELPGNGYRQHWTRNVVVSPDGTALYVSVGSRSNVDVEPLPRASIQVMGLDGSGMRTFASGLRNPVGLGFHPETGALYTTVNERDGLGDDLVPDYFTRVVDGAFYGWPYAYLSPSLLDPRRTAKGRSERPELAQKTRPPDVLFQAHSAALGLCFPAGESLPDRYRRGAFVAFRGSWNRETGTGYKIVFVPFDQNGQPVGTYEDFVTGFLVDPKGPTTWGRPVGMLALPDGSLLFTEEMNGRIFRISGSGASP